MCPLYRPARPHLQRVAARSLGRGFLLQAGDRGRRCPCGPRWGGTPPAFHGPSAWGKYTRSSSGKKINRAGDEKSDCAAPRSRVPCSWRDGAAAACKAHNLEVGGSNPSPATIGPMVVAAALLALVPRRRSRMVRDICSLCQRWKNKCVCRVRHQQCKLCGARKEFGAQCVCRK